MQRANSTTFLPVYESYPNYRRHICIDSLDHRAYLDAYFPWMHPGLFELHNFWKTIKRNKLMKHEQVMKLFVLGKILVRGNWQFNGKKPHRTKSNDMKNMSLVIGELFTENCTTRISAILSSIAYKLIKHESLSLGLPFFLNIFLIEFFLTGILTIAQLFGFCTNFSLMLWNALC